MMRRLLSFLRNTDWFAICRQLPAISPIVLVPMFTFGLGITQLKVPLSVAIIVYVSVFAFVFLVLILANRKPPQ